MAIPGGTCDPSPPNSVDLFLVSVSSFHIPQSISRIVAQLEDVPINQSRYFDLQLAPAPSAQHAGYVVPPRNASRPRDCHSHIKVQYANRNHRDAHCALRLRIISNSFLFLAVIQILTTDALNLQIHDVQAFRAHLPPAPIQIPAESGPR